MRLSRLARAGVAVVSLAVALTACGSRDEGSGSLVDKAKNDKKLTIGIKFDQPGLGLQTPGGAYEGFDVEVAKYIAKELGVDANNITWKQTPSSQREDMIANGQVDFIVATYSITDKRKQKVDFAGPYFIAHQDLLVRADDKSITGPDSLSGKKLCSVQGSTSAQKVKDKFPQVQLQNVKGYSECLTGLESGAIDALTTDDTILAGYAAQQPGKFKLVGKGFSDEKYGVGLKKGDTKGRDAINAAIQKMETDGSWKTAADKYFGPSGYTVPAPPAITEK
ncbi:glutamate ABC transporter substrate-binding protein [Labedaea rhizosphaerae]|uniref:Amino acid ABC transporter substrate-binding protein (PAAT family) n=1 Tax=Labedaea rhizosphaerae TaxID=598644 RepID=A0A4R6RSE7_LABRH|nr:glutamate ABC transporter substrate-binding protein [Labedaea rhizosphaerae]TDP89187.1 amino acid ABC transporter substrate-binding protein (PAAT family) [Labedaea rhizosphaerae]